MLVDLFMLNQLDSRVDMEYSGNRVFHEDCTMIENNGEKEMKVINLTTHTVHIYREEDFVNLVQQNPTTFVADGVGENVEPVAVFKSVGNARISVVTEDAGIKEGIPFVKSTYGELVGIPEDIQDSDILIVSLPTKSNATASGHKLANQMVSPFKVVRDAANTSNVLGAIGLSY